MSGPYTWRCLACGAGASFAAAGLDPAHPLVACSGIHAGRGLLPGTRDLDELDRALRAAGSTRARKRHAVHLANKLQPDHCHYCAAMLGRPLPARAHA